MAFYFFSEYNIKTLAYSFVLLSCRAGVCVCSFQLLSLSVIIFLGGAFKFYVVVDHWKDGSYGTHSITRLSQSIHVVTYLCKYT